MSEVLVKRFNNNVASSYVFVTSYTTLILGLILLNAFQSLEVIPSHLAQYMRAGLHLIPFITLSYFFSICSLPITKGDVSIARIGIASLMLVFMLISALSNGLESSVVERMLITLLHLCNFTIFLPLSIKFIDINLSTRLLAKLYCWFLFFVCTLILYEYVYGEFVWTRVGYPYIPGVYAYMCLLAFIVSIGILRFDVLGGFFLINVFLSGSRSALALAVAVYLINYFIGGLRLKRILVMVVSASILLVGFLFLVDTSRPNVDTSRPNVDISRPYTVERKDLTSGRIGLWREAGDVIKESPLLGYSKKMVFGADKYGEGLVVHNSFLDLSVQYGLVYAVLSYFYWFSFTSGFLKQNPCVASLTWSLFLVVTTKSLITNTFWTNMGDGVTYFVFVMITMAVLRTKPWVRKDE